MSGTVFVTREEERMKRKLQALQAKKRKRRTLLPVPKAGGGAGAVNTSGGCFLALWFCVA